MPQDTASLRISDSGEQSAPDDAIAAGVAASEPTTIGGALRGTRAAIAVALVAAILVNAAIVWRSAVSTDRLERQEVELARQARVLRGEAPDLVANGRGYLLTGDPRFLNDFDADRQAAREAVALLRGLVLTPEGSALVERIDRQLEAVIAGVERRIALARDGRLDEARAAILAASAEQRELFASLDDLVEQEEALLRMRFDELGRERLVGLAVGALLLTVVGGLVTRTLSGGQRALETSQRRLTRRVRQAALGADVGAALIRTDSLPDMLQACAVAIVHHLDAAFARVWTLDEQAGVLELRASAGLYTHLDGPHGRVPVGQLKIGLIAEQRRPHLTNAVVGDPRVGDQAWAKREGMVAFAGYPLLVEDRVLGVMALFAGRPLPDDTLDTLESVADAIALGIERKCVEEERARLLAAEQAARGEAEALAAERAAVLSQTTDGVIVVDAEGCPTLVNEVARRIHGVVELGGLADGYSRACRLSTLAGQPHPNDELPLVRAVLRGETVIDAQWRIRRPDGSELIAQGSAAPVLADDGARLGSVLVLRDVTARHELERQKEEFLASASHDLKNPLASIKGIAQIIQRRAAREGGLDPERAIAGLKSIDAATNQIAAQIDRMLDVSRASMGRALDLDRRPTDLVALVRRLVAAQQEATERHRLCVETTETELIGQWDAPRLERALVNLLNNAVKYSPDGGEVRITLAAERDAEGVAWSVLTVRDEGVGIPATELPRIFERFHRSANVRDRIPGTGIGLADVRQTVEQHGGTVMVTSQEGVGSTFTVRLPLGAG
ncbi:MAG: GAF domain-containing protein [Chloroflexi bacterium]|nr:GAF domain-containing protein [Chloroflexota bacterium]